MRTTNLSFIQNRDVRPATLMPYASVHPQHPDLAVSFGQITFDAEGQEARGPFFSRVMHWPGGGSGVTLGRGYDMGRRTRLQVIAELRHAGMSAGDATFFGDAAGLRGDAAARFVRAKLMESPVLSLSSQRKLFEEITTQETIEDIRRLLNKPEVTARYGYVSWTELSPFAREVLFDLRYRGDYTPKTRESIQPFLVTKDDIGLRSLMNDTSFWTELGVPPARIQARAKISTNGEALREAS